ncbi:MAG TPA: LysR substrate-binding domain-containing protein [Pseudonocardia sp.]|nr:LysR substrate-binding domain-containing protein [Pseudonocardia sp.]
MAHVHHEHRADLAPEQVDVGDVQADVLAALVGELGSIGRAAERTGVSQPAASKRLSALERRLRLDLVNRSTRGSALTVEGKAVCQWAGQVLAELDSLIPGARALRGDRDNELRVASSMTLAEHLVPRWIVALRRQCPQVYVSLRVTNSEEVETLVAAGEIGIGFTESRMLVGAGIEAPRPMMVLDTNAAVRAAVLAGLGPAVLSAITVHDELEEGRLVEVPVAGVDLRRRLRAVWPRARPLSGPAEQLLDLALRGTARPRSAPPPGR